MPMVSVVMMAGMLAFVSPGGGWQNPMGGVPMGDAVPQAQGRQNLPQGGGRAGRGNLPAGGNNVQEMQEYFDAFALVQAQRVLRLDDEAYGRFFPKMSRVYQLRRAHGAQRMRVLNEIRRLYNGNAADDAALVAAVNRLDDMDAKFGVEMREARQAVDEVLTTRQRAGLRFFEEDMERQKIDFLTRARQGGGLIGPR